MVLKHQSPAPTVLLICDGCRRYAKKMGLKENDYYLPSELHFRKVMDWFYNDFGITHIISYGLSTENLRKRDKTYLRSLYRAWKEHYRFLIKEGYAKRNDIKVRILGEVDLLPIKERTFIKRIESETCNNNIRTLDLLIAYSGQREIIKAASHVRSKNEERRIVEFEKNLQVKDDIDMVIRTSEKRLSNCPLYQSRYAELFFIDKLFPESSFSDYEKCLTDYWARQRRFGK